MRACLEGIGNLISLALVGASIWGIYVFGKWLNITNPLLGPWFVAGYLAALALWVVVWRLRRLRPWEQERVRVRRALLTAMGLNDPGEAAGKAPDRILALVPCVADKPAGKLAGMRAGVRVWLAFLPDRMLLVEGATGAVVHIAPSELTGLYLIDHAAPSGFPIAVETEGGASTLLVERLEDVARIVNVFIRQGITLKWMA